MPIDSFTVSRDVAASPERVWQCLTDPGCLGAWWRDTVSFDARLGGTLSEPWRDAAGRERLTRASVISFHPLFGLVVAWADADWTFDTVGSVFVARDREGSRVEIEHQGWRLASEAERGRLLAAHRDGWAAHLASMSDHAVSGHSRGHRPPRLH